MSGDSDNGGNGGNGFGDGVYVAGAGKIARPAPFRAHFRKQIGSDGDVTRLGHAPTPVAQAKNLMDDHHGQGLSDFDPILAEWTDPNLDYATRVANLVAGNGVPALSATTVKCNGGGNTLIGGPGPDLFFGNLNIDLTDWGPQTETFVSI